MSALPDALAPSIESTFEVLADPNLPTWRKRVALVQLAEAAFLAGKSEQVRRDLAAMEMLEARA